MFSWESQQVMWPQGSVNGHIYVWLLELKQFFDELISPSAETQVKQNKGYIHTKIKIQPFFTHLCTDRKSGEVS